MRELGFNPDTDMHCALTTAGGKGNSDSFALEKSIIKVNADDRVSVCWCVRG